MSTPKKPEGNDQLLPKTEAQHDHPCKDCAFRRDIKPNFQGTAEGVACPSLGGSPAEVYVAQVAGPYRIPCHMRHDSTDLAERLKNGNPDCAGVAVMRSNIGVADKIPPVLLHLPADTRTVFADMYEFYAHHKGISVEDAKKVLDPATIDYLQKAQFAISQIKTMMGMARFDAIRRPT
jgi:hypothetical protein